MGKEEEEGRKEVDIACRWLLLEHNGLCFFFLGPVIHSFIDNHRWGRLFMKRHIMCHIIGSSGDVKDALSEMDRWTVVVGPPPVLLGMAMYVWNTLWLVNKVGTQKAVWVEKVLRNP